MPLAKPLLAPLPPALTEATGVHQSDVVVRSAIIAGLADMRANPWLLDFAFASLAQDSLTAADYGLPEVAKAKAWLLSTDVQVFINVNPNEVKFPCVSIALLSSVEQEQEGTTSDTHYQPWEANSTSQPAVYGPLTPKSYNPRTGQLAFDATVLSGQPLSTQMVVVDVNGSQYPILSVLDGQTVTVAKGIVTNLSGCYVKVSAPALTVTLESAVYKETYSVGCHVDSEPVHLTYLHSAVLFCLLRYRETLLEGRGFERSTLASSDFRRDDDELPEMVYSRYVQVTGSVRQAWPKVVGVKLTSVIVDTTQGNNGDTQTAQVVPSDPAEANVTSDPGAVVAADSDVDVFGNPT